MATKKQIEANRRNSQFSTGPVTESGKVASSMNALKHGLYSQDLLLFHEDFEGYEVIRRQLFVDNEPSTAAQLILIDTALTSYFLSRRAAFMLADVENNAIHGAKPAVVTFPILMTVKNRTDRAAMRALESLAAIRKEQNAAAPKPQKEKGFPESGFVPPEYPAAPDYVRALPYDKP